jgi:nitroreductase
MEIRNFNTNEINELIKTRRSIYPPVYKNEVVDDDIIKKMLENANWAPTHKMTQPWHFTVFKGEGLKKLAEFQSELYREVSEKKGTFDQKKYDKLSKKPTLASHVIGIGMKRDINNILPEIEEVSAVACAVQNMMLTATAYGLGCYWGTGGVTYMEEAKPFFGLEPKDTFMGFLFIGIPEKWHESTRKPIEDSVQWVD